jgi:hypothetical protein
MILPAPPLRLLRTCAICVWISTNILTPSFSHSRVLSPPSQEEGTPSGVWLLQRFSGDEKIGQCGFEETETATPIGLWSPPAYINTDTRPGGCVRSFAILDPAGKLDGLIVKMTFAGFGQGSQCDRVGPRELRPSRTKTLDAWSAPYRIDTDGRYAGGCQETFEIYGRDDVVLDVQMLADGIEAQCPTTGKFTATTSKAVTVYMATDDRPGGCYQRLRLRILE